jgi:hypothetical protein
MEIADEDLVKVGPAEDAVAVYLSTVVAQKGARRIASPNAAGPE